MPVPARRHSRSRVRRRRAHDAMKPQNVGLCMSCNAPLIPHRACQNCGTYKGKQVLDVTRDMKRTAKQNGPKHDHGHDHEEAPTKSKEEKAS